MRNPNQNETIIRGWRQLRVNHVIGNAVEKAKDPVPGEQPTVMFYLFFDKRPSLFLCVDVGDV